jgi:deoxyhypusine synthase
MESVSQMEIGPGMSIEDLVAKMGHCGFGARRVAEAVSIYEQMLGEKYTKFFALSGAMVPAGLRNVVSRLINDEHIDVLVTTGANLVHDIIESYGSHSLGAADSDDAFLRSAGLSRIYDVFLPDEHFVKFEELMQSILPERAETVSGREFLAILGSQISDRHSILRAAYDQKVPIFCPAISDSMIGLQAWLHRQTKHLFVDTLADIKEIVDICYAAERSGVMIVGGGVPKNFALQSMLVTPKSFDLAVQLTTDTPEAGGLSGATLSEAVSWGKISAQARYVTVYGDATITFPLIAAATLSRLEKKKIAVDMPMGGQENRRKDLYIDDAH